MKKTPYEKLTLKQKRAVARRLQSKMDIKKRSAEILEELKLSAILDSDNAVDKAVNEYLRMNGLKNYIEKITKGQEIHVDNENPADIVKNNPKPPFSGKVKIDNPVVLPKSPEPEDKEWIDTLSMSEVLEEEPPTLTPTSAKDEGNLDLVISPNGVRQTVASAIANGIRKR